MCGIQSDGRVCVGKAIRLVDVELAGVFDVELAGVFDVQGWL
jgi:hypothetical protein